MYGADIERLLSAIDEVRATSQEAVCKLVSAMDRQLFTMIDGLTETTTPGSHGHPDGSHGHEVKIHRHYEDTVSVAKPAIASGRFTTEMVNLKRIEKALYTSTTSLNSGLGSPYTELDTLLESVSVYSKQPTDMSFIGQHTAAAVLANAVVIAAIDAKHAVIHYQDGLQRGYDACLNGGSQSVVWDDFNRGTTTGNVR